MTVAAIAPPPSRPLVILQGAMRRAHSATTRRRGFRPTTDRRRRHGLMALQRVAGSLLPSARLRHALEAGRTPLPAEPLGEAGWKTRLDFTAIALALGAPRVASLKRRENLCHVVRIGARHGVGHQMASALTRRTDVVCPTSSRLYGGRRRRHRKGSSACRALYVNFVRLVRVSDGFDTLPATLAGEGERH